MLTQISVSHRLGVTSGLFLCKRKGTPKERALTIYRKKKENEDWEYEKEFFEKVSNKKDFIGYANYDTDTTSYPSVAAIAKFHKDNIEPYLVNDPETLNTYTKTMETLQSDLQSSLTLKWQALS